MNAHHLKSWSSNFQAILDGRKTFDIRENDRDYAVGELLLLREWHPEGAWRPNPTFEPGYYTDRSLTTTIVHMEQGRWGMPSHLAVLGLGIIKVPKETP